MSRLIIVYMCVAATLYSQPDFSKDPGVVDRYQADTPNTPVSMDIPRSDVEFNEFFGVMVAALSGGYSFSSIDYSPGSSIFGSPPGLTAPSSPPIGFQIPLII